MSDAAVVDASGAEKRVQVENVLGSILQRMNYPARIEMKDMPDGGIGVAMHFEGELPGITPNKRSYLVDCLQFLVNKVVNRPNAERRWVSLGVNAFPEPRPAKDAEGAPAPVKESKDTRDSKEHKGQAQDAAGKTAAPDARTGDKKSDTKGDKNGRGKDAAPPTPKASAPRQAAHDEKSLKVKPSAQMTELATALAKKSAAHGRYYGVMLLSTDDRARVQAATAKAKGCMVKIEGDGHWRRVTFVPEKPVALPKKQVMPDYDEEE